VELDSILFGFYTEDEVKRLSVRKLTKPERLDAKGCPVPGGLLDPAMGPLNANDTYVPAAAAVQLFYYLLAAARNRENHP
jgi:DNA-directed RNA polymerase beta' subunit